MAREIADFQKVAEFFSRQWKGEVTCPVCKTNKWRTNQHVVYAPFWEDDPLPKAYPMVVVVCETCSYSMFFSAVKTGALPPDPKPDSPQSKPGGSENV